MQPLKQRDTVALFWRSLGLLSVGLCFTLLSAPAQAQMNGSLGGLVRNDAGIPQMGALVTLLTSDGTEARKSYSEHDGSFEFATLSPGSYGIRVALSQFFPAMSTGLAVKPGNRTYLDVNLRGLFASLRLNYAAGSEIRDMTDRWKWILRANYSRRNVLRFTPVDAADQERNRVMRRLGGTFADTHAYARVSAGLGVRPSGLANQSDLGSAFAVATSLFGNNDVTVSGNMGATSPSLATSTTAFRTTYTRDMGMATPEVALTVRQLQASSAATNGIFGFGQSGQATPRLETISLELGDSVEIGEATTIDYGVLYESVRFVNQLEFVSPYAKIVHRISPKREVELSYSSGVPPTAISSPAGGLALQGQVDSLGMFPRVAMLGGRPTVQRAHHMEVAFRERFGKNMIEAAVFQDSINDVAVAANVPDGIFTDGNLVPDLFSQTATLNGGTFRAPGVRISYARQLRDRLQAALGYGLTGVLTPTADQLQTNSADELRSVLESRGAHMLVASVSAELPRADTKVTGSYQWVSRQSVISADLYNDFAAQSDPGLNVRIRQPLPFSGSLPGKFEASADFRNLLKSGYVPLQAADGRMMYLLQAIRSYRGALSFIF
jgi:hypothetical protein